MIETQKNGRIRIQDVADAAGVSRTAVYAVLNRGKDINTGVSEALRTKIQETIRRLGYIPNNSARSLVSGRTCNIGIMLPDYLLSEDFAEVFNRNGYMIFPLIHKGDPELERRGIELLVSRGVDAIVIARTSPGNNLDLLQRVIAHGITLIIIAEEREGFAESRHIIFDEHKAMALLVSFLLEHGMRRFALQTDADTYPKRTRLQYAAEAIRQRKNTEIFEWPNVCSREVALKIAENIKRMPPDKRPQAMIAVGDLLAWLMIDALRIAGLRVPQDIQVTGIGNDSDRYHLTSQTTIELSSRQLAAYCRQSFDDAMNHRPKRLYVVEPKLIVRESAPGFITQ